MCVGVPGIIKDVTDAQRKLGTVDIMGVRREISLACIVAADTNPEDYIDQWVLVHVGFAMSVIDAEEAARTIEILEELGEAQEALAELKRSA